MDSDFLSAEKLFYLLLLLPAFVTGLTIHEFAHAWSGWKLGDDTAQREGRLTLDPLSHLDPFGSLIIVIAVLFNAPLIGWARPVPFNPRNLSHPRRDSILIAIAGPISNVIQAIFWLVTLFLFRIIAERMNYEFSLDMVVNILNLNADTSSIPQVIATMITLGVIVNVNMAVFNMIPLPPLDGHWVLEGLGPPFVTEFYNMIRAQPFVSYILLILLLRTPVFREAMRPFGELADNAIMLAFGFRPGLLVYG